MNIGQQQREFTNMRGTILLSFAVYYISFKTYHNFIPDRRQVGNLVINNIVLLILY